MIPVLIAPVVNRVDLLERMLRSVDVEVGRTVIVDMTADGIEYVPQYADRGIEVIQPLQSVGYHGAVNLAIGQTPEAPWWLWVSNDIEFGPGDLANVTSMMDDIGPLIVTGSRNDSRMLRDAYAAVNVECIDAIGLPDEWTFFPIYYSDDDYERRARLGHVEWREYDGTIGHGETGVVGSETIRSDPKAANENSRTFPENYRRYIDKWGGGPGAEVYTTPWNTGAPLSFTRPDLAGRAARMWR